MKPEFIQIQIQRVDNGWVLRGFSIEHCREYGYLPDGTMVAATPDKLSQIVHEWASQQKDETGRKAA